MALRFLFENSGFYKRAPTEEKQKTHGYIWGISILEIIGFYPQKGKRMGFGLCRRKNKIWSKINLKLVLGNVFDLQNEFRYKRTRFGGFKEKITRGSLFGHFWGRPTSDPKIFAKKRPFKLKKRLLPYFCMRNPKKWSQGDLLIPQIPT